MCRAELVGRVWERLLHGRFFGVHCRTAVTTLGRIGLVVTLLWLQCPKARANPIAGQAAGNIAFDGGFGGGTSSASYSSLPFASDPPIQYTHTFLGDPSDTNHSNAAFGGGYFFNPGRTQVSLSSGTELWQYASGSPHTPATVTINWDATFRVDTWTNLSAFIDAHISGHVGADGFVAVDFQPFYANYVTDSPVIHPGDPNSYADLTVIDFLDYFGSGGNAWRVDFIGSAIVTRPNPPQEALQYIAAHPGIQQLITQDGNFSVPVHFQQFIAPVIPSDFVGHFPFVDQHGNSVPVYGYNRLWGTAEFVAFDPNDPTSMSFTLNPGVPEPSTLMLGAIGGLSLLMFGRHRRRRSNSKVWMKPDQGSW
jgi:hypothetical protein